jgi:phage terminase large subunit
VTDDPAVEQILKWRKDPALFVRDNFHVTPDEWQKDGLDAQVGPGVHRTSFKACAGPGKSCEDAWIMWWFMSCFGDPATNNWPRIACLSSTADNLRDNLWAELHKWYGLSEFLKSQFEINQARAFHKNHKADWFISARSFSQSASQEEMGEALSGLHSDYAAVFLDECGGMHPLLLNRAEQAMATVKHGLIVLTGNPTSRDGCLFAAEGDERFKHISITGDPDDPKRSPRVNIEEARENIRKYGRDNAWVRVYVLGQFPETSLNSLLGEDDVRAAMKRVLRLTEFNWAQKRIGIDVARFGDDRTVMAPRQGKQAFNFVVMRNQDGPAVGGRYIMGKEKFGSELDTIDDTGGWASSVVDFTRLAGHQIMPINMASQADEIDRFHNKRAEVYWRASLWVKAGGCLPDDPELVREASAATYFINRSGKIQIEEKDQIKKRIGKSPDKWDAFTLTFAFSERASGTTAEGLSRLPGGGNVMKTVSEVTDDSDPLGGGGVGTSVDSAPWERNNGPLG